jgi:putative transposase
MAKKKRHSNGEISAKLAQASQLANDGKTQSDIARALGISVMTFHRWRKAQIQDTPVASVPASGIGCESVPDQLKKIATLRLENSRLRRLVTDLLLEKVKLEETQIRDAKRDR